ncbi:hypothetical protein MVEN_01619700 [Mycena venus]|uniref:Uncharacterized protein n=1 Tax=Mycena venus TaxID=2733690 RepID=A0A8H7CRY8_9AGAR|nr:hypothetical protein MVEN_01619700 [Mycena venus]
MRLALYFLFSCAFAHLSFVSGLRNVTVDDNDPSIIYSEGWNVSTTSNPLDFGGFLHFSANSTATASLTFRGVAVYLMGPFWSSSVGAQVILDGQGPFVIDLHDNGVSTDRGQGRETIQSQVVWGATELVDTDHTMVISMPPGAQFVVLDGLIYSTSDVNDAESAPIQTPETRTSSGFTTITTTNLFTSSSISPSPSPVASSFVQPTTTSSSPIISSSNLSSSSRPAPARQFTTTPPVNVAGSPSDSVSTVSASAAPAVQVNAISTNVTRYIVVGSIFAAALLAVVLVLLTCLRRRRIRQRRQQTHSWSQKFTPPTSHAARIASRPPPVRAGSPSLYKYEHSPSTAVPLLPPVVPAARRVPRSPLATSPPIMPPNTPSPQLAEFPMPPAVYSANPFSPAPMTPLPLTPLPPQTPLPMTPLPPATPGTPWSTKKIEPFL